jgi:hypothetical protein
MRRRSGNRGFHVACIAAALSSTATATARAGGAGAVPAMPFWAMILLVVLIGSAGYFMTRRR